MPPESVQLLGAYQKRSFLNCEKQKRKSCLSVQLTLIVVRETGLDHQERYTFGDAIRLAAIPCTLMRDAIPNLRFG